MARRSRSGPHRRSRSSNRAAAVRPKLAWACMPASAANDREAAAKRLQGCKIYSLGLALCPKLGAYVFIGALCLCECADFAGQKAVLNRAHAGKQLHVLSTPSVRLGQLQAQWSAFVLVRDSASHNILLTQNQASGIQHEWNPYGTPPSGSVARASSSSAGDATIRCASPAASWTTTMTT